MKKILKITALATILLFLFFATAVAQEIKTTWDYPMKPGMEEWNQLKTEEERIAAVQIPEDVLAKLSPAEVVRLCMPFPLFGYYTAFNNFITNSQK